MSTDDINTVRDLIDGDWSIRRGRTGRWFPSDSRLVQLQNGESMREFHLDPDEYDVLMQEESERKCERMKELYKRAPSQYPQFDSLDEIDDLYNHNGN